MEYQLAGMREKYHPRQDTGWESTSIYAFIFHMKKYLLSTPQTVVLEKTLESPLVCKKIKLVNPKGSQSWIFIARTDAEPTATIFWPPVAGANSLEKTLMLGKTEGRRRRGRQRMRWLKDATASMDMSLSKLQETGKPGVLQSMVLQSRTRLSDWTTATLCARHCMYFVQARYSNMAGGTQDL